MAEKDRLEQSLNKLNESCSTSIKQNMEYSERLKSVEAEKDQLTRKLKLLLKEGTASPVGRSYSTDVNIRKKVGCNCLRLYVTNTQFNELNSVFRLERFINYPVGVAT